MRTTANNVFDPFDPLPLVMTCCLIDGVVKKVINDAMEPEEITNLEICKLKFILKWHVTSVITGSVQLVPELCMVLALT